MFSKLKLLSTSKKKNLETSSLSSSRQGKSDPLSNHKKNLQDDDTVITNFTEPYLEAYFDGELNAPDERRLEKVLGIRYVQHQMIKRGELRSIISRDGSLSIPAPHDLKQEKKRVWNEIEHELKLSMAKSKIVGEDKKSSFKKSESFQIDFSRGFLKALSAGAVSLVIGLVYLNKANFNNDKLNEELAFKYESPSQNLNRDYVLNNASEIREILKVVREDSHGGLSRVNARSYPLEKDIRDFEAHNQFVANFDKEELRDLGKEILIRDKSEGNLLTFVSNR